MGVRNDNIDAYAYALRYITKIQPKKSFVEELWDAFVESTYVPDVAEQQGSGHISIGEYEKILNFTDERNKNDIE